MKISEFDYNLDQELVAQHPADKRKESRLLVLDKNNKTWQHKKKFEDIIDYFKNGDVLVLNNTKVINARILGKKCTGGKVKGLVVEYDGNKAIVMIQTTKRPKIGDIYNFNEYKAEVMDKSENGWKLNFYEHNVEKIMEEIGHPPLPPYIKRDDVSMEKFDKEDRNRYQTVYAKEPGSIAAPTAGLHFTEDLLGALKEKGVEILKITLHVGTGTFLPIHSETVQEHNMHYENYEVSENTANKLNIALKEKRRIIATGTTSCRVLETVGKKGKIEPGSGRTNLFIYPGYKYSIVNALITNFHLPKSTLLLLVSAFAGKELIKDVYRDAIKKKYRFYSYGDAMFIY